MKILIINTYYYNRGGDTTYTFSLAELLRANGHEVRFFSMKHPNNFTSPDEKYFVDYIDYVEAIKEQSLITGVKVLSRSIYSFHAKRKLKELLTEFKPDIAHLQNIHAHITPSILYELKKYSIPVFWTLHDYKLICPNTSMLLDGKICELCKGSKFYNCTLNRCKKKSYPASFMATLEAEFHRFMNIPDKVNQFISPSFFLKNKFIEFGWDKNKLSFLRNFLTEDYFSDKNIEDNNFIFFFGRLEKVKGIETLLAAMKHFPKIKLKIAGEGSMREHLEKRKNNDKLNNVEFIGSVDREIIKGLLTKCSFVVVPSEWYENCPYSIMESQAAGKPVIGSEIGGIPELVINGKNGLTFEPGNSEKLAEAIELLVSKKSLCKEFGIKSKEYALENYHPTIHYNYLMNFYNDNNI